MKQILILLVLLYSFAVGDDSENFELNQDQKNILIQLKNNFINQEIKLEGTYKSSDGKHGSRDYNNVSNIVQQMNNNDAYFSGRKTDQYEYYIMTDNKVSLFYFKHMNSPGIELFKLYTGSAIILDYETRTIVFSGETQQQFPVTVITDKNSNSIYAKAKNGFYVNAYGQDLLGQCTWYVYGRATELSDNKYLPSSVAKNLKNSELWDGNGRDGGNWSNKLFGEEFWFDSQYAVLPISKRKIGLFVSWPGVPGNTKLAPGHIAIIEKISSDKKYYKVSEFNFSVPLGYSLSKWLPFSDNGNENDKRGYSKSPKFCDPSNKLFFK